MLHNYIPKRHVSQSLSCISPRGLSGLVSCMHIWVLVRFYVLVDSWCAWVRPPDPHPVTVYMCSSFFTHKYTYTNTKDHLGPGAESPTA